jgi:hypothetical protein
MQPLKQLPYNFEALQTMQLAIVNNNEGWLEENTPLQLTQPSTNLIQELM